MHRPRHLPDEEVTLAQGIRCTTPARTLVDLASVLQPHELRRALERTLELNLFDRTALDAVLRRSRGRRGIRALRRVLRELPDEPAPVRSELESRFLELIRNAQLPTPVVNARIGDFEVDFHWPDRLLIVETDGRPTHGHAHAFERDRRRDLALELAGWHVIRVNWDQVVRDPSRIVAVLQARLIQT